MLTEVPLRSPDFYTGDPYPAYRVLRVDSPIVWNDEAEFRAPLK